MSKPQRRRQQQPQPQQQHPQQQQRQQQHPQQHLQQPPHYPAQLYNNPQMQFAPFQWGPAQAGAQLVAGAFPPNPQNASFASISHSMVAKDEAKRELKLWGEEGGAIFFSHRGGNAVSSALSVATLSNLVRKVA